MALNLILISLVFLFMNKGQGTANDLTQEEIDKAPEPLKQYWDRCFDYIYLEDPDSIREIHSFGYGSNNETDLYYLHNSICEWNFVGSSTCLPEIICPVVDLRPYECKERLTISDGIGGKMHVCAHHRFNEPWKASHGARDLFIRFEIFPHIDKDPKKKYRGFHCKVACSMDFGAQAKHLPLNGLIRQKDPKCVCGKVPAKPGQVEREQIGFPWVVAMVLPGTRAPFCVGTIINSHYVLTAAHCFWFFNLQPVQIEVLVQAYQLDLIGPDPPNNKTELLMNLMDSADIIDEKENTQRFQVMAIKMHSLFSQEMDFDVALLRLDRPVNFQDGTTTVCLPKVKNYTNLFTGEGAEVVGWGLRHDENEKGKHFMQKLDASILDLENCKRISPHSYITERMLCTAHQEERSDSCKSMLKNCYAVTKKNSDDVTVNLDNTNKMSVRENEIIVGENYNEMINLDGIEIGNDFSNVMINAVGISDEEDNGGPLLHKNPNGHYEQIGIASWRNGCGGEDQPVFYSRITELAQWIYYNSNEHETTWCQEH